MSSYFTLNVGAGEEIVSSSTLQPLVVFLKCLLPLAIEQSHGFPKREEAKSLLVSKPLFQS